MAYPHSPLVAFVVGVLAVIVLLVKLDLPAFLGLVIAAITVGLVAPDVALAKIPSKIASAFGEEMAGIGIAILMAAVIGKSMMESGAAERVVRAFTSITGRDNAEFALWGSSSFLSIPVFFDNVFYLMAPLARSMRARIGDNYALYIVVVGAGAATTHVFVPPTPGPLAVASEIGVSLGVTMLVGLAVAIPSALVGGLLYGKWINRRIDIPLRDSMDTSGEELTELAERSTAELPGVFESLLPILVAVVLVGANTVMTTLGDNYADLPGTFTATVSRATVGDLRAVTDFVGAPTFALTLAAMTAAVTYLRWSDLDRTEWSEELTDALRNGGNIAAITAAGGAFGAMLAAAGVGDYIANGLDDIGLGLLVTAWTIAAAIRVAQGSATVAMLTTAGIVAPLTSQLAVHPAYLVMAIGAGGNVFSWYNDSGFWLVKEIAGLTQAETLKTWTALTTIVSVTGLITVLVLSSLFPLA
ncbi:MULTISPECIES: GntP family permease [Halorussus]|uniref:GntP family permease n=1 Tax=Halorussus TaxID=1070314 RepID=UPI00209EA964|nr:gluconate:H+ symporter [Halorussus vallis]USZ77489.1 GntP family permease [Halorussus vallis]